MSFDEIAVVASGEREPHTGDTTIVDLDALAALALLDLAPELPVIGGDYEPIQLRAVMAKLLHENLLKKYEHDNSREADAAALAKFLQVNKSCKEWKLEMTSVEDEVLMGELRNTLYRFFYPRQAGDCILRSLPQILEEGYTGPGASRGAKETDFYSKMFASPLTYSSDGLYRAYRQYTATMGPWADAEVLRYSRFGRQDSILASNKLCFVPKKVDVSRCICVEPSLNMFYQLGVKQILEARLKSYFGIDFSTQQEKNRTLAQLGSMRDGSWVTIDLSSASDSLSLPMIRSILPREPLGFLELLRSRSMELPPEMGGGEVELEMISTMGNGYTFPLQTIVFSGIVSAAHRVAGVPMYLPRGRSHGNFGVYGDDIICETEVLPLVLRLLTLLGFVVNAEKSFVKGPFRESCGGDFWNGHLVRPVFIRSLRNSQDLYVALNQLNRWTARSGIALPLTAAFLRDHIEGNTLLVPRAEQDDAGLKAPHSAITEIKRCRHVQSIRYQRYTPRVSRRYITHCGIYVRSSSGEWRESGFFNPHGLWVAFLAGHIDGMQRGGGFPSLVRRQRTVAYRRSWHVTPNWDHVPMLGVAPSEVPSYRFEQAYEANEAAYIELRKRAK